MNATMESENELVAQAVRELARRTRFPVAFGGLLVDGEAAMTHAVGTRTRSLDGLSVRLERGLGGRAMLEQRPRMTHDYGASLQFTHDYDSYVLGEGLRTLIALPILVNGKCRGVLYAGSWEDATVGDITAAPAMNVADGLAVELRIRDEVATRVRTAMAPPSPLGTSEREELRESFAELRSISAAIDDAELRKRILHVEQRLLQIAGGTTSTDAPRPSAQSVHLSPRETDVLACAALGATNAEIAAQLGLREGTVKAYLGTAMSKLDASTRHAAVARARRAGLLP